MEKPRIITGFTLIEILIVISIGSIVMTIAAARYNQLTQRKRIEQQTKNTITFLRKIKKMADSGEKSGCTGNLLKVNAWNVQLYPTLEPHDTTLEARPECSLTGTGDYTRLDKQAKVNVQAQHAFAFLPLSKGAEFASGTSVQIYICKDNTIACGLGNAEKTIEVDSGGNINEL